MSNPNISLDNDFFFEKSSLIRSFDCGAGGEEPQIFFYHLEKTGGTSVLAFLQAFSYATGRDMGIPIHARGRTLTRPPPSYLSPSPSIIGGHSVYGYHKFFYDDPTLAVVIRHPVDRVLSDFFWQNRNQPVEVLADKQVFLQFLNKQSSPNLVTESLLTEEDDQAHACDIVMERLSAFQYVTTTPNLAVMMEVMASVNGLPSLFLERAKENPHKEIKVELHGTFAAEITSRNERDAEVFAYAETRQQALQKKHQQLSLEKVRDYGLAVGIVPMGDSVISRGKTAWVYDSRDNGVYTKVSKDFILSGPKLLSRLPAQIDLNGIARMREKAGLD